MAHILIAVFIQLLFGITTHRWWLGAIAGSMFFMGREITQAEYRWIAAYGYGRRANMSWWGGFDPIVWNFKSLSDMLFPIFATVLLAYIITRYRA